MDRLSRSQKDTLYLIEEIFLPNNVDFVSINESFDTGTSFGRAMVGILSVFAQLEREQFLERSRMGKRERAKEGLWGGGGGLSTGYTYKNGQLIPDENAWKIKKAFELCLEGYNIPTIAKKINVKWSARIYGWLRNPVYAGKIVYKGEMFEGQHKPIVSWETFLKVQKIMDSKPKFPNTPNKLLVGLIYCKWCGARYAGRRFRSKHHGQILSL